MPNKTVLGIILFLNIAFLFIFLTGGCSNSYDQNQIYQLRIAIDEVQSNIAALRSKVDEFSDGATNWRDIVPEIESSLSDLESSANNLDSALINFE